jgi:O-methyltransferase
MKTAIIYGATDTGKRIYNIAKDTYRVIGFVDGNPKLHGKTCEGFTIEDYSTLKNSQVDYIIMGVLTSCRETKQGLLELGISEDKIIEKFVELPIKARIECLKNIAYILNENNISGSCAELGVYQGEFSKSINEIFSDRKLYLFDTFNGLPEKDSEYDNKNGYASAKGGHFSNTSEDLVLDKMKYKENCIICKGYFPQTALNIEDTFCFVNLDADLYKPTYEGLKYFYPRMESGGIILIHDYFSTAFKGVKEAVMEFSDAYNIKYIPIGDMFSVAIIK